MSPEENPYRSPVATVLPNPNELASANRFRNGILTVVLGTGAGVLLGAVTNAINGIVYPWHFSNFAPPGTKELWRIAVVRGVEEGAVYGLVNSSIAAVALAYFQNSKQRPVSSWRVVLTGSALVMVAWLLGGLLAIAIPGLGLQPTPNFYYDISSGFWTTDRRWVLWSIRGAVWGSPFATFISCFWALRSKAVVTDSNLN